MGTTISAMLEEVQALYKQHSQSCFLYLSSEVIKVGIRIQPNSYPGSDDICPLT